MIPFAATFSSKFIVSRTDCVALLVPGSEAKHPNSCFRPLTEDVRLNCNSLRDT